MVDGGIGEPVVEERALLTLAREDVPLATATLVEDAVQRAVSPERVRFLREDDGMLVFRAIDGVDAFTLEALHELGDKVVQRLAASTDVIVREVLARNDRIGIT
jgi:hypothetical protein